MPRDYDSSKDKTLSTFKVKNDREGYHVEVKSYDNREPRISIKRFYLDGEGKWRQDAKTKYPRFTFALLAWLFANKGTLDKGRAAWSAEGGTSKKKSADADSDDSF